MKLKVYVIDLEIPPRVKKWGLRFGIPLALLLGGGAVAYAAGLVTWTDGQTLKAADLNGNFNYLQGEITGDGGLQAEITGLQGQITALQDAGPPEALAEASATNEMSSLSTDLVYQSISLTLTPGTWMVYGDGSAYTLQNQDGVQLGLYNDTASTDVPGSRSAVAQTPCTQTSTNSCLVALTTSSVVTVTSNAVIRLHAYRNGTSQVGLGGNSVLTNLAPANRLMAVQLP
jgi:hypothetical protein